MAHKNIYGRSYNRSVSISEDYRMSIVNTIEELGGDKTSMVVPHGTFAKVARQFKVTKPSVKNFWEEYCYTGTCQPMKRGRPMGSGRKLTEDDVYLIKEFKEKQPSLMTKEVRDKLLT